MKIQPLTTPHAFTRLFFGPEGSASAKFLSFTDLFLSAVTRGQSHRPSLPLSTPVYANPAPPLISPYSPPSVTQSASAPPAQDSLPALEEDSGSPSSQTEMFPLSGPEAVPPGYAPALLARLSVDSETGEARIHLMPTTTITSYDWLSLLKGEPLPSLLGQIRRQADAQGVSLSDTPLTIVNPDLPPPFAGKSLEELSQMVLPTSFYYTDPNGPYGSIGGQLPATPDQQAGAFALIDDYVVDLGEVT